MTWPSEPLDRAARDRGPACGPRVGLAVCAKTSFSTPMSRNARSTLSVPAHAEPMAARWRLGLAGAFLLLAVYACGFLTTRAQDLRPSDDNIWLYVTGAE